VRRGLCWVMVLFVGALVVPVFSQQTRNYRRTT
jgi:hypothetical protein